jgi:hypothetical protein
LQGCEGENINANGLLPGAGSFPVFFIANCGEFCRFPTFPAAAATPMPVDLNDWENLSCQPPMRTGKLVV